MELKEQSIELCGKKYLLKVTLGFWKNCGFTREEAEQALKDPNSYLRALKLAIFYGNKKENNWTILDDLSKEISDDFLEELETDYSDQLSMAMVYYLPAKIRDMTIKAMEEAEEKIQDLIQGKFDEALGQDSKKK